MHMKNQKITVYEDLEGLSGLTSNATCSEGLHFEKAQKLIISK